MTGFTKQQEPLFVSVESVADRALREDTVFVDGEIVPGADVVEEIGEAAGVTYRDDEPLRVGEKELQRDAHRWELDPASSDDYLARSHPEVTAETLRTMRHCHREKRR